MMQFQIRKDDLTKVRIVDTGNAMPDAGANEIVVRVERFGFSANNITYAVAGDTLGYWQFFPPGGGDVDGWGLIPVWGFAEILVSNVSELPVGERLFGYFPPATHLRMKPGDISSGHFFDFTDHRLQLPKGYNIYRRVAAEPGYDRAGDNYRMLLFPLYLTSFSLWDMLKEADWYGARQVIIVSASSKTSIGLAYALNADAAAPRCTGLTSERNLDFVEELGIYDTAAAYDDFEANVAAVPSVIVDMSGNAAVLGRLHRHLGNHMVRTLNVGLTHWEGERKSPDVIRERSEFFFAPSRIQKRMKDWGAAEFGARSSAFVAETSKKSAAWLELEKIDGLPALQQVFGSVRDGTAPPQQGIVVEL